MFRIHNNYPGYYFGVTPEVARGPHPAKRALFPQGWQLTKIPMHSWPEESEDQYRFSLNVSGVNPQDIAVVVEDGRLIVELEKEYDPFRLAHNQWDKAFGIFRRSFDLPQDADLKNLKYQVKGDRLEISIYKELQVAPPKKKIKRDPLRPAEL